MRRSLFLLLGAASIGAVACDTERAIGRDPVGDPAYGIRFVTAAANVPQGTVVFRVPATGVAGAVDTVKLVLRGLDSLAGNARYTLWVRAAGGTDFVRLPGRITITRADTVINAQGDPAEQLSTTTLTNTDAFSNGGSNLRFNIDAPMPVAGRPSLVLLTIEDSPTATQPNPYRRPIWAVRTATTAPAAAAANNAGTVRFGFFSDSPDSVYIFTGGAQRGRATFRGEVLVVNDSSLPRPPRGYFYATYLVKRDEQGQPIDTVYLGPQTSPAPRRELSLRHADSVIVDPLVQTTLPPTVLAASTRVSADTTEGLEINIPFRDVADVVVSLELKNFKVDEARMGPAILLRAEVPAIVRTGPRIE